MAGGILFPPASYFSIEERKKREGENDMKTRRSEKGIAVSIILLFISISAWAQSFNYTIQNSVQTSDKTIEFDLYLQNTDPGTTIQIAAVQAGITVNSSLANGGTITASLVSGMSEMNSSPDQRPSSITFATNCVKIASKPYPGCGNGTIMSTTAPGTRLCRVKLTNTVSFAVVQPNLTFVFGVPYPTKFFWYKLDCSGNAQLTTDATNCLNLTGNSAINTTEWTGATSSDWSTASNWSFGLPLTTASVTISATSNNPVLSTTATVNNLTVNSGASVNIASNGHLTVSNTLTNNAGTSGLVIKSDASGSGTLLSNSSGVQGKVQSYLSSSKWHLISSPVSNAVSGMFTGNYLKYYNEATSAYVGINLTTIPLTPGKGYLYWNTGTGYATKEYSGLLNAGDVSFSYAKATDGWNLAGNPYPSVLDWDLVSPTLPATVNGGVSQYDPITNTYKYYITGGGAANTATQYISPGQGFFVQATGSGSMTLTNAMRSHDGAPSFYKSASNDPMLLLNVSGNNITTQTAVRFSTDATTGIDRMMDMCKIMEFKPQVPALYTKSEGEKMVLNTLPLSDIENDITIPVYFEAGIGGNYQIDASEMESIEPSVSIYLEDITGNHLQDLRLNPQYIFLYDSTEHVRNMLIHFKNSATGIEDTESTGGGVICYNEGDQLYVTFTPEAFGDKEVNAHIEVQTLTGQQIYKATSSSLVNRIDLNSVARSVYLVKVTYKNQVYVKKIIL